MRTLYIHVFIFLASFLNLSYGQETDSLCNLAFKYTVEIRNLDDEHPIKNCKVTFIRDDSVFFTGFTDTAGLFTLEPTVNNFLEVDRNYIIELKIPKGEKELFHTNASKIFTYEISTIGMTSSSEFYKVFKTRHIFGCILGYKFSEVTFKKNAVNPDSSGQVAIMDFVKLLNDNPTWQIKLVYYDSSMMPNKILSKKRVEHILSIIKKQNINMRRIKYTIEYLGCLGNHDCADKCRIKITNFEFEE